MSDSDHPVLTAVGIAAVALGVLSVVQPSVAAAIGVDYAAVVLVGLLALVQAVRVGLARRASEVRGAETPDVETVEAMPTPGDEFDRTVARVNSGPRRTRIRERADLRETLEDAAVRAVADRHNCSREAAAERVEDGTWTDDPHAASFLGAAAAPSPPLLDRMKVAASAESSVQFRLRRTADAIARVEGVTPDEGGQGERGQGGGYRGGNSDQTGNNDQTGNSDQTESGSQNRGDETTSEPSDSEIATDGDAREAGTDGPADDERADAGEVQP